MALSSFRNVAIAAWWVLEVSWLLLVMELVMSQ